jgi:hypothetical protein
MKTPRSFRISHGGSDGSKVELNGMDFEGLGWEDDDDDDDDGVCFLVLELLLLFPFDSRNPINLYYSDY